MICNKCGQAIPDSVYYCEHCGEPVNQSFTQQPFNSDTSNTQQNTQEYSQAYQQTAQQPNQQYQQPNQQYPPYGQPVTPQAFEYMIDTKLDEAKTMGIIAIVAGLFIPILGIILGCIGISKINDVPLSNQYGYEKELKRKKAKNLCMTGIILPIVLWVVTFLFVFLVWGLLLGGMVAAGEFAFIM